MSQNESIWCPGCEEDKPVAAFYRYGTGKLFRECKTCNKEYQRNWRAERRKKRVITPENKDFFQLGATVKDDHIRDLEKALSIAQKAINGMMEVIREADSRDQRGGRIPA